MIYAKLRIKTKRGEVVEKTVREGQIFSKDYNDSGYFAGCTIMAIPDKAGTLVVPVNLTSRPHDHCQFDGKPQMFHMVSLANDYIEILEVWEEEDVQRNR